MPDKVEKYLSAIEQELKILGWWSDTPPSHEALASELPFCVDTLSLAQWLQFVLLARLRQLLKLNRALPTEISVYPMAEYTYAGYEEDMQPLLAAIAQLDAALSGQAVARQC
ncbi:YqcC family protein [Oceanisphaera avium]|uniref:YqcC-like domain-containing protein n=1 Tax=Oceanisphaera avium TaxID=1903694 RepID=A0A1Y0CXR5_9GAMM|nr:YqcC family protein [Oceanisphaera avium]ART79635.1 hypothetical protein CBP12_05275 [Oceanisphaera avium]